MIDNHEGPIDACAQKQDIQTKIDEECPDKGAISEKRFTKGGLQLFFWL